MRITHTSEKGRAVTLFIDQADVPLYQQRRWSIVEAGLIETGTRERLVRLIVKARPDQRIFFRDGNRFNVQRENLVVKRCAALYLCGRPKRRLGAVKSGEWMTGVTFLTRPGCSLQVRVRVRIGRRDIQTAFSVGRKLGPGVDATMGRSEAYRRAVCWRIGMLLAAGHLPDQRSLEIFYEEHRRPCPYPRDYLIHRADDGGYHCCLPWRGRRLRRSFKATPAEAEETLRKAVFWCVGTLFARELMPDAGSMNLLKKTIAVCETPPVPEELYAGNGEYRGNAAHDGGDVDLSGLAPDGELAGEEDYFNTASVPQRTHSYHE